MAFTSKTQSITDAFAKVVLLQLNVQKEQLQNSLKCMNEYTKIF